MRVARSLIPPAVVIAAVLATAVVGVTGSRPVAALSTASVVSVHGSGPATTRKTPGWRTVATFGEAHGVQVNGSVTAVSAKVAWSVWTGPGYAAVVRWTGKSWVKVPLPAKLSPYVHAAVASAGSSAGNFWLFSSYRKTQALQWTGKSWKLQPLPSWAAPKPSAGARAVVFGPDNVWLFDLGAGAFGAHYNGRTWSKVKLPDTPVAVTGLAPDDIYVLGRNLILRWTGSKWLTVGSIPLVPVPVAGTFAADAFTAGGSRDAWLAASAYDKSSNPLGRFLFHWNGKAWTTVVRPAGVDFGSIASDGAGGLWASGVVSDTPAGFWDFYHLAGGHWTEVDPPAGVFNHEPEYLTAVPGTRSLWGVAAGFNPKTSAADTVIVQYGS